MRRLILLRHGAAERQSGTGSDFDRALTGRGRDDARAAGVWLAANGIAVELALVSPALRARQTWEEVGQAFPGARSEYPDAFYDAHPSLMLAEAEQAAAESVLIVAHNPGLHSLALRLAQQAQAPREMQAALKRGLPTAAVAVFGFDGEGRATGEAFHAPANASKSAPDSACEAGAGS